MYYLTKICFQTMYLVHSKKHNVLNAAAAKKSTKVRILFAVQNPLYCTITLSSYLSLCKKSCLGYHFHIFRLRGGHDMALRGLHPSEGSCTFLILRKLLEWFALNYCIPSHSSALAVILLLRFTLMTALGYSSLLFSNSETCR